MVGKFPTSAEAKKYKRKEGEINWIPTKEVSWWESFTTQNRNLV